MPSDTRPNSRSERGLAARPDRITPRVRRGLLCAIDGATLALALALAYEIGFEVAPDRFIEVYRTQMLFMIVPLVAFKLAGLHVLGVYRGITRYTGLHELILILLGALWGLAALIVFNVASNYIPSLGGFPIHPNGNHIRRVPWGVVLIDTMLTVGGLASTRIAWRFLAERMLDLRAGKDRQRVLILGAEAAGEQAARDLLKNHRDTYRPLAFVDPDPALRGRRIHGIPVAGGLDEIEGLTQRLRIDIIMIALPRQTPALLREIVDRCRRSRVEFRILPDLSSVMEGRVEVNRLRPVEIEDLLGRPPVLVPGHEEASCVRGRRVLVTGAGGSIGSELCRQALQQAPTRLIMLGRGENSLYEIHAEIEPEARRRGIELHAVVGDVRDAGLIQALFEQERPDLVLHAAAHKHVHLMEAQPAEAIKNNVTGTRVVAEAARAHGAERFILISTDKAVRPRGVMGASKRLAEMLVRSLNDLGPTSFIAVRFGNVLGSRGSVIPLFRRQIAAGGPVTVTHPEVTRYFMTIPEAVRLVLEAGTVGQGGELFLLDMGQPIKIVDLARQLITLSGLEPGHDIAIEFSGLRPGEKIFEELLTSHEGRIPTEHPKIFKCRQEARAWAALAERLDRIDEAARAQDEPRIRLMLAELIEDYQHGEAPDPAGPVG